MAKHNVPLTLKSNMSRFEIEDILSQDKRGVVFRAHDLDRGHTVALRRFFPFGQDGGGFKDKEADAFRIAAQRLLSVTHPALRSIFSGAVDPIDKMPYIVAEWVDGARLDDVLAGETLDPRLVIQLLRLALEASLSLSEIIGEEAVWVETETDSIFVGSEESGRGFVFWLSPFKWLGAEFGSRKLAALVGLGEHLAGWKGKLIGDHAGHGLGGWLKWMRNNPEAGLAQALEAMPSRITDGEAPSPPAAVRMSPLVTGSRVVAVKPPRSTPPLLIAIAACLVLAIGGLAFYQRFAKTPSAPIAKAEAVSEKPAAAEPAAEPATATATSTPSPQPSQDAEAVAVSRVNELAAKLAAEKEAKRTAAKAPAAVAAPPVRNFTPGDREKMKLLKANGSASVTGVVLSVRHSKEGNSLYFEFAKPRNEEEIMAVAHKREYKDDFTVNAYEDIIGKKVRFDGTVFREPKGRQFVKITARKMIKVLD